VRSQQSLRPLRELRQGLGVDGADMIRMWFDKGPRELHEHARDLYRRQIALFTVPDEGRHHHGVADIPFEVNRGPLQIGWLAQSLNLCAGLVRGNVISTNTGVPCPAFTGTLKFWWN
jgi:hypothetical protein